MQSKGIGPAKVVVITGASAGVGRAAAVRFATSGAKIGLVARDETALVETADEISRAGAAAVAIAAIDVSDGHGVEDAARRFEQELGPIDLWINDAMLTVFSPVRAITPEEYRRVTEVTYLGVVHGAMAALRHMQPRGAGQIINIGSALAYRGIPLQSAYCGAKHAIRAFTASLRSELAHDKSGISVSIIELPAMNTPQFDWARTRMPRQPKPMGQIYQPEAAAEAIYRASETKASEYWVGFSTCLTIIGNMVAPAFMDRYLAKTAVEGQETAQSTKKDRKDNLDNPITELHRTRGAFNGGARHSALIISGSLGRGAVIACGAVVFFVLGGLIL